MSKYVKSIRSIHRANLLDVENGWTIDPGEIRTIADLARELDNLSDEQAETIVCVLIDLGYMRFAET